MSSRQVIVAGFVLAALTSLAHAQSAFECKKTETQAECHARLKCKADEEISDCQKRLLKCKDGEDLDTCKKRASSSGGDRGDRGGGDRDDRGGGDRDRDRDDRSGGDDRGRDDDRGGDDRGRDDDRAERGDGGGRGRRGGGRSGGRRRGGGSSSFETIKTFGLGLELGEPTGLNGKYFVSKSGAIDFGVGWIYRHYYYGDGIHLYADYLWHPISLASSDTLELPFYVGVGLRYWDFEYCVNDVCDFGGSALGVRVPLGISFDFNNAPLDIFVQLVPTVDFLYGDYRDRYDDRNHVGVDGSIGFRYWFK